MFNIILGRIAACSLFSFFMLSVFVGCSKKSGMVDLSEQATDQNCVNELSDEQQKIKVKNKDAVVLAKQQVLPVPVGYKIKDYVQSQDAGRLVDLFIYYGYASTASVVDFYKKELEFGGWSYKNLSTKNEGLLIANKHRSDCVISIRGSKPNTSSIHLFIKNIQKPAAGAGIDLFKVNGGEGR